MEYSKASKIAIDICYKLQPHCEVIKIAGSVRRKKPEVKDIEICAILKREEIKDLFGETINWIISPEAVEIIRSLGQIGKGTPDGKYMQILLNEGIYLDLFLPSKSDFYRQYAIRTGSADYSYKFIATGWKKIGWVGTPHGLRLRSQCTERKTPDGKSLWICHYKVPTLPPVWKSEEEFFNWMGVKYLKAEERI